MKGLAKRNNKTRGKTVRRRKNNRKTIRKGKKRGGAGLENTLPQQKAELMVRKNKADKDYQTMLNKKATVFNAAETVFKNTVEQENEKKNGYTETKNGDGDENPHKKTKYNDPDGKIAAADVVLEQIMNALNKEIEIATTKYNAEIESIQEEFSNITQREKEQQETAYINAKKDANTNMQIIKNKEAGRYLPPYDNGTVFMVDQAPTLTSQAQNDYHENLANHENMENYGLTIGGNKRKTHKKRK